MKIHIKNARIIDPASGLDKVEDIAIAAGRILALGATPPDFNANRVIDATGLVACPGLVDLSARLREPGFEYKATLESELLAAVAGGVTTLVCPPDTDPPLDEPGLVEMLKYRARSLNLARVYPLGALTQKLAGERLAEMAVLRDAGCIAFSQADAPLSDTQVLLRALEYAATFDIPVWLRPQDAHLSRDGVAHDGAVATRLGLRAIPACAETVALATILLLVRATGARVHLCRLSSREAVDMVRRARHDGLPVTCDVSINHLHLCDEDIGWFDANCRLVPPLRSPQDRAALRAGLGDGTIDALCSDHTPVDDDAKQRPFGEAEPGATGLELLLPLTLRWAQETGLPLKDALARVTSLPARILGVDHGRLAPGLPADLCLFDPAGKTPVDARLLRSQGRNTPFLGQSLPGRVRLTLVEGHVVFEQPART
ncbi:dihydroorotase [Thiobacter aerophilum]|uniref:Dihydroorotase n=1 Tax=Thiobacter aerophilum TaxID=3121275 RepID=A0ABV0EIB5_9BURK